MSTQHTPGTWKYEIWNYKDEARKELQIVNATNLIATLQCDFVGDNPYTIPHDEAMKNAQLIAAAPKLLRALKILHEYVRKQDAGYRNGLYETDELYVVVTSALTEAMGDI